MDDGRTAEAPVGAGSNETDACASAGPEAGSESTATGDLGAGGPESK